MCRINPNWVAAEMKVNSKVEDIRAPLTNATMVEIILSDDEQPLDPSYLQYCQPWAKKILDEKIRISQSEEMEELGAQLLDDYLFDKGLVSLRMLPKKIQKKMLNDLNCDSISILLRKTGWSSQKQDRNMRMKKLSMPDRVKIWLDEKMEEQKQLGWVWIRIEGMNGEGISEYLTGLIKKNGGDLNLEHSEVDEDTGDYVIQYKVKVKNESDRINLGLSLDEGREKFKGKRWKVF
jgi:(p)ppGpp synthase/HD superfamily hydrolase